MPHEIRPEQPEEHASGPLWPSADYERQLRALGDAVGEQVYIVEIKPTRINMGVRLSGEAHELVGVIDFPRPDPARGIAPHLVLLDDGRGVNLGRIARISVNTPFDPAPADILYQDGDLMQRLVLGERRLSAASIAATSRALLAMLLGRPVPRQIQGPDGPGTSDTARPDREP